MSVDKYDAAKAQEVRRQQFDSAKNRLDTSTAVQAVGRIAEVLGEGFSVTTHLEYKPGESPRVVLSGPSTATEILTQKAVSVDLTISAPYFRDTGIKMDCSTTAPVPADPDRRDVSTNTMRVMLWSEYVEGSHEELNAAATVWGIKRGVEKAGMVPENKKQAFEDLFAPLRQP